MLPSAQSQQQQHARSHALLLLQKLLNLRDSASPLTLVLDTLEQTAKPVVREFLRRAKVSKNKIIFISYAAIRRPPEADIFVKARGKSIESLRTEIISHYPSGTAGHAHKVLLVMDTLNPLASTAPSDLAVFLSSLVTGPAISLVAVYHGDVPLALPVSFGEYEPHPLTTLSHLATAVLRVSSLYQEIERRKARNRSLPEPGWGLGEGREGVLVGLRKGRGRMISSPSSSSADYGGVGERGGEAEGGLVLEMEVRRRSGRAVVEKFVLVPSNRSTTTTTAITTPLVGRRVLAEPSRVYLLSDHLSFRDPVDPDDNGPGDGEGEAGSTFNLGLTEKQRRAREGVVLPYFDAQTEVGAGEGGRILYEMGREDDFDDEEDEI